MMRRADFFAGHASNPTFVAFQICVVFFVGSWQLHCVGIGVVDHPGTQRPAWSGSDNRRVMEYEEKKASWIMPEDMEGNREKMKDFLRFRGRKRVGRCSLHAKVDEPCTTKVVIALVATGTLSPTHSSKREALTGWSSVDRPQNVRQGSQRRHFAPSDWMSRPTNLFNPGSCISSSNGTVLCMQAIWHESRC